MLKEAIAESKEEISFIGGEGRVPKEDLGRSGKGSSSIRRENWLQMRWPIIKLRDEYVSTTDEEYDQGNHLIMGRRD